MKVVIVSDSHGNMGVLKRIVQRESPFDLLFHLGDGIAEALQLQKLLGFNLDGVEGNNDVKGVFPASLTLRLEGKRCFFTHGHLDGVDRDLRLLTAHARELKAKLVFFGHSHHYCDLVHKGVRILNPGSVCEYLSRRAAYLVLRLEGKEFKIEKVLVSDENA